MHRLTIYFPLRNWKKGDYPTSPFLHLAAGTYSSENGQILLSAQLMTDSEIDHVVEEMKQELDDFRKRAKEELRTLRDRMRKE